MDTKLKHQPPVWPDRFLEFYCNPSRLEQIQGDAYEIFYTNLEERGLSLARFRFFIHVVSFFRWSNIKRTNSSHLTYTQGAMFKNYFKIGWRNLIKQKGTTFISVFGLACAVGCCMVAYLFIAQIWFKGMYQPYKDEIFQLTYTAEENDGLVTYGTIAEPISELIPENLNQVKNQTRVKVDFSLLIHANESFNQRTMYIDPGFMEMFEYRMEYGYPGALHEPNEVILTHQLSEKLFGNTHPIGQEISIVTNGTERLYKVGGVLKDLNDMDLFNFDLLVNINSLNTFSAEKPLKEAWKEGIWTFIQVEDSESISQMNAGFENLRNIQNAIDPETPYKSIQLEPYTQLTRNSEQIERGVISFLALGPQILLAAIASFILLLAVFNYVNISVLMASRRLKEIGIRKVIGSKRSQLVIQFLSENLMVCSFAIFLGCLLTGFIFLPGFNEIASKNMRIDLLRDGYIWLFLGGLLLFITFASGLYPAIYVSSFKPVSILNGNQKIGSKGVFTSVLLTFQFTLAIISIVAGIAFVQTNYINAKRDWGYDNTDKIIVNVPNSAQYSGLKEELSSLASVTEVCGSQEYVGNFLRNIEINFEDNDYEISLLNAESNYPELLGLQLKQGRLFTLQSASDKKESILVNQAFLNELSLTFPLDQKITIDSIPYNVVGVVEDFHTVFFQSLIDPLVIRASQDTTFNYLTLKTTQGAAVDLMPTVKKIWYETIPRGLFEGKLQADVFRNEFEDVLGVQNILLFSAILSVLLSTMGLFGLVSLSMNSRIKDFCVRKVFGADLIDISYKLMKRYLIIWLVAAILGSIASVMLISAFLNSFFAFNSGVGIVPLGSALVILFAVITGTVASQIYKVMKVNPAIILKSE
jgi:ABC-type antimicrobial peptide transport system permease subunit